MRTSGAYTRGGHKVVLERLGIITDEVSDDLNEGLDFAAKHGLSHVEIRSVGGSNVLSLGDDEIVSIRQRVHEHGLFVSCLASPVFKCALHPARVIARGDMFGASEGTVLQHFLLLERALTVARLLGTNKIRVFSFWREQDPSSCAQEISRHLTRASEMAESAGVTLLLENEPTCNGGFAGEIADIIRTVNSPSLSALWDPGNEVYGGKESPLEGYCRVRSVIKHVHLKDARINSAGHPECLPIGRGSVPFAKQLAMLVDDGYQGLFTLEPHYVPDGGTKKQGCEEALAGLVELLRDL